MPVRVKQFTDRESTKRWNAHALHPLQSWEWGEARKKMGIEVLRLGAFQGSGLRDVFSVTYHKVPWTSHYIGYLPKSSIPTREVLDVLEREGHARNCLFYKIEPHVEKSELTKKTKQSQERARVFQQFLKRAIASSHPLFPAWTIQLDLTPSEADIMRAMKHKTRYNIHLARKKGVVVKEMTNAKGFAIFKDLYFETCKRQKYRGHHEGYHKTVFEEMKRDISHIFVAFYGKTPLSAYHMFIFNDVMYYPYGGSSFEHRKVMASNVLMWEVIRYGKKNGCRLFDMWGSLSPRYRKHDEWAGFTRFKEGYGGRFVEHVGSYDLVLRRSFYRAYGLAYRMREFLI